jgi:hypothetical protein
MLAENQVGAEIQSGMVSDADRESHLSRDLGR